MLRSPDPQRIAATLCRAFEFPLLRIRPSHLPRRYNDLSLLEWIIDVYQLQQWFNEAQRRGQIPPSEIFDPFFIVTGSMEALGDPKARRFPYWIPRDARVAIRKLHEAGKVARSGTSGLISSDEEGDLRGIEWLAVTKTHGLMVKAGMREQQFPVLLSDLLDELLFVMIYEKLQEYLATGAGLQPLEAIYREVEDHRTTFKMLRAHFCSGPPAAS